MGRHKKYTKKAFKEACDKYFKSISRTVAILEHGEPILNDDGEQMHKTEYLVSPSKESLCLFLDISDTTWENYAKDETFKDITEEVDQRIRAYLVEELNTRQRGSLQGLTFNLQNNYGWKQKLDIANGEITVNITDDDSS